MKTAVKLVLPLFGEATWANHQAPLQIAAGDGRGGGRALAGHQDLVDGGRLREGEISVEFLHEVLAKWDD